MDRAKQAASEQLHPQESTAITLNFTIKSFLSLGGFNFGGGANSNDPPAIRRQLRKNFVKEFYLKRYTDVAASNIAPFEHYLKYGRAEGRSPRGDFEPSYYARIHAEEIGDLDPFTHWVTKGRSGGYAGHPWNSDPAVDEIALMRAAFDVEYYARQNPDVVSGDHDPLMHFATFGWREGRDPNSWFSVDDYLELYPDVRVAGLNPFAHYVLVGRAERRSTMIAEREGKARRPIDPALYAVVAEAFDEAYYASQFDDASSIPLDPVEHYIVAGWRRGLNPAPNFSTSGYLAANQDVADAGVNPFYHYLGQGRREGRDPGLANARAGASRLTRSQETVFTEHLKFASKGERWEEFDSAIARNRPRKAKILAYYLPQFHPIPENDAWWGRGFTEWRNLVRGQPRFVGHYQPRVPGDLGFYDLRDIDVMRRQTELAKAAGIHGFCFYYYSFNGKRILERPIENLLNTPEIDFPFALIWANENWTRTWDGFDQSVLLEQQYREEDDDRFLADLARHFKDPRYIRVGGRPLLIIYRPGGIPNSKETIARWRKKFDDEHGLSPLIFMCQGFNDIDPRDHGLDGALEFPPHKVAQGLPPRNKDLQILDSQFSGHVMDYDSVVSRSTSEEPPPYPLIKAAAPSWDNEARRPGRGMALHGSTPQKYENWLRKLVQFARTNPTFDESFVGINAWNEWAEGAYLEPDVYFGSAYLNATARAAVGAPPRLDQAKYKVVLVGHDAYQHGAQLLVLHIGEILTSQFGMQVHFVICGDGPLLEDYRRIGGVTKLASTDVDGTRVACARLVAAGYARAIVNTTVSGWTLPILKSQGFVVTTLVHELSNLIQERSLQPEASNIASESDTIVFPAEVVRDSFLAVSGQPAGEVHVEPQGLYRSDLLEVTHDTGALRDALELPSDAKVVINVGYADMRKGFDIFAKIARDICESHHDFYFVWIGDGTEEVQRWLLPHFAHGDFADRIRLTGYTAEIDQYYAIADVFFLTSREDPFPSVVMEAMAVGLPVVAFEGSGGTVELVRRFGRVVDHHDDRAIIDAIVELAQTEAPAAAAERRKFIASSLSFDSYCASLIQTLYSRLPRVSVVVPNYNYARYLDTRLESIFQQTLPIFETIVLDDCSSDDSIDVVKAYAAQEERRIKLVANEQNSGSVFRQWRKGVELARGEYVWIAEADDESDPRFLQFVVDRMVRENAVIGFSDSWQIGSDGETLGSSYRSYVNDIVPTAFDTSFTMGGREFLSKFLSVKNVILNVSGVVIQRKALLDALDAVGDELYDYAVAGDWRLYIDLCSTGSPVVYEARALNGHRRHQTSVTHALKAEKHFAEIVAMQRLAASRVSLDPEQTERSARYLEEVRTYLKPTTPPPPAIR